METGHGAGRGIRANRWAGTMGQTENLRPLPTLLDRTLAWRTNVAIGRFICLFMFVDVRRAYESASIIEDFPAVGDEPPHAYQDERAII